MVRSVVRSMGTEDFWRLKSGVGRPPGRIDPADFVLDRFTKAEVLEKLDELGWKLDVILATHHHHDHVGGTLELDQAFHAVYLNSGCMPVESLRQVFSHLGYL